MRRISSGMPSADMEFYMRRHEENLSNIERGMVTNNRLLQLRDDPIAASHAVRYESYIARLERFKTNTKYADEHYNNTDSYLREVTNILQRIRELTLEGANGIYTPEDHRIMAFEINELLNEIVNISNYLGPDMKQAFAGDKVFTEPFRIVEGMVEGGGESMIVRVEYRGSGATRRVEIGDNMFAELDMGGGEAFWAEKMHIISTVDATDYRVQEAGSFFIDGVEIFAEVGDTLPALVAKINDSAAPVKASIDVDTRGLVLEGTNAHLIRAEDRVGGASILRDLGIINGNMVNNAPNWDTTARVYGGSLFDMVIRVRDAMLRGDNEYLGSLGLAGIDSGLNNILVMAAKNGSRQERVEFASFRIDDQIPNVTKMFDREAVINMETAAMELALARQAYQATLQVSAKILSPSLLDFLR